MGTIGSDFSGTAELVDGRGEVIDTVLVNLQARPSTGARAASWGGQFEPRVGDGSNWDRVVRIRLDNGGEADVTITNDSIRDTHSGIIQTGTILGWGDPPF